MQSPIPPIKPVSPINPVDYQTVVEWDVPTWKRAVVHWEHFIAAQQPDLSYGLELGSRHGGLSYFFAKKYDSKVCCSDYGFPSEKAKQLHELAGLSELITYHDVNATQIPFADEAFDFVVFKSMLGAVGARGQFERIEQTLDEIYRVLKPGGVLFFAENLRGSWLHQQSRALFIPWGKAWHYLSLSEMTDLLEPFSKKEIHCTGFSAAFVPKPIWLKNTAAAIDAQLNFLPDSWKYVAYGHAIK